MSGKYFLRYDYITKYLNENGYPLSKAATGQLYLLQADDIDKTVKNAPLLAISVDSYNQMRALSDLPEITLDSDEYGIAWSFDTLPETITQFNQEVSSIHAGNSTLHKKSGADYQDPTGMVLFTSRMQAVYIIPDEICNNLLMATSFYAGNTEKPLAYDFAERFDQEMWKYQFNLGVFSENQLYVRLGTLQDNEGISNALLLRLVGTYAALVLIIICFTILSVQQLTDTIEQKKRFQIISKLGVNKSDCGRYIRQQMIFKFGLPVALKELLSQKVTSILILIAVVLSTMMTTIVGQSIGVLSAMREQQAIAIGGNRYATFLQMNADQLHALEQDERLSYVGKSIYMGSLELSPSLTLGLMEYLDDNAAIYPSSTSVEEGRLPEAPMEIALSEDILKYLGFEGGIGDKITLSLQKNLRHNIVDSYSYTAEFVLTGRLKNNYLGYTSGTVTGVVGEGTAEQLLPESYIYYNVDIQTTDKKSFQAVVDDINKELNIHELDTSYNIVYLNALGISYTANSEDANDKGFSFMTVAGILVGSLILLAAGLVIYNILKISVSKRIKGYGTLRAIGGEKGQLYQIIVIKVILLCLMGIPIGMLLGFLSARGILEAATGLVSPELFLVQDASELKTLIAENSSLNGTLLVLSGAITLAFALFAALPAARSAARVSPIMAMSGTNLKIRRRKRKTKKIHNFEAYYARLNLKRNKGRTAITILSLVMSITVFIALQGFSSLLNAASALQDNHLGDYQITNESVGFTTDDLNTLRKNEAVQSVAAIQFSLYEQNENGLLDEISLEFQLKPGETFQVVGLNDEYWDYFMGDQLPEEQLGQLKSGNACIVRNPIPMSYGEDVLEFTNIEAGENICVAGMELNVLKTLDGYDGYLGIGNGGFTNGVQVIVDDAIYERLTGKDTYSEFLPTLNEGADREIFDTFIESFCDRTPGTTFLSYEESDQQLKESFAQIQMLAWGLILFVGLIGILNIINTVYTNIHTRVTEIGMQRAIGMSAGSLYKTFLWEGAYYGVIASVIGSVLGYVCTIFIEAATSDTIQLVAIPVMPILEATLLAVGACLLATAIPLRKISKMNIVDSIETVE